VPETLVYSIPEPGICRIEINNPPLNILTQTVRRELGDLFTRLDRDDAVRVVIFGSGQSTFCAGADLKEFPLRFDPAVARAHGENAHRMILALASLRKPVIAAIHGNCMGGGLELALGCGFRFVSSTARFALPEIKRGVWPGTGGIFLLERLVGPSRARRLLLTGNTISSEEAMQLGLADEVVSPETLDDHVMKFARELANRPASSVNAISALLDNQFLQAFRAHLQYELELFVQAYQLPAAREGNLAFFEKREPRW
jgi:enoyl-CoA hydratase/carnithine racemase